MKKILAAIAALVMTGMLFGCGDSENNDENTAEPVTAVYTNAPEETPTEAEADTPQPVTEGETEPEPEPDPPVPAECDDPNAITFDDDDCSFATIKDDDKDSAKGELSVVEVMGNKMLKFTDSGTNHADGTVQKILIDAAKLLTPEDLAKVRRIECDLYADATAEDVKLDDGTMAKVPGWVGGGSGANVANDKWIDLDAWSIEEYDFEMSGAAHLTMKFLLAAGGQCWNEEMTEATFQLMRWGSQNEGNFYVDNIVFFDEEGNSLSINKNA